jgi:hypothetical protein
MNERMSERGRVGNAWVVYLELEVGILSTRHFMLVHI